MVSSPVLRPGLLSLAHGWTLVRGPSMSAALVREFIRPAVRAVPSSMAGRVGSCRISLPEEVAAGVASQWTVADDGLKVSVTTAGCEEHDVAMELLLCLGQVLWERLPDGELRAYWMLLGDEISLGIEGEIDEQVLEEKRGLGDLKVATDYRLSEVGNSRRVDTTVRRRGPFGLL